MADTPPTATVAGQSIALHVTGYPDVPNRWGAGHIRVTGLRLDYGSTRTPDARHVFVTGVWVRDDSEVTDAPVDQYYDAHDGNTDGWPDWIAELARAHEPATAQSAGQAHPPRSEYVVERALNDGRWVVESIAPTPEPDEHEERMHYLAEKYPQFTYRVVRRDITSTVETELLPTRTVGEEA